MGELGFSLESLLFASMLHYLKHLKSFNQIDCNENLHKFQKEEALLVPLTDCNEIVWASNF